MNVLMVGPEPPQQPEVLDLLRQSDLFSASLYPVESRRPLNAEALTAPAVHFLVARLDSIAVGCCALIELGGGAGELKRMIVDESVRQQGVGRALLQAAEAVALGNRVSVIRMEVGARSTAAHQLYRRSGYNDRGPFGVHNPSPHSIFLEKRIGPEAS